MKILLNFLCLLWISGSIGIAQPKKNTNPPATGFDLAGSDLHAMQIADEIMVAMGGRLAWDDTQLIAWNFDGVRKLVWDKWSGNVRIDNLLDDQTVLMNINSDLGRVFRNGEEVIMPDSVAKYVRQGKQNWIHDSYWLLMPFKLKDAGVALKYIGVDPTQLGKPADVIQINFKNGSTMPGVRYKIWVDKKTHLVAQWEQYVRPVDKQPLFTLPWDNYQQHGHILLSGNRGDYELTDIMIFTGLPGEVFSDFSRTDFSRYPEAK